MKIENQVCTLEQAKKLKTLGINQDAAYLCFLENSAGKYILDTVEGNFNSHCRDYEISVHPGGFEASFVEQAIAAFTVAELGVMLPHFDNLSQMGGFVHLTEFDPSVQDGNPWYCVWEYDKDKENAGFGSEIIDGETEAQARAAMLIYCLERQLTTAEEVNQRLTNP